MGAASTETHWREPLVDAQALHELRLLFGARAGDLLATSRDVIAARAAQLGDGADAAATGRVAHELAGMAGQLGLRPLAAEAARLEALCASGDTAAVAPAARSVVALAAASLAALSTV